jgi:hypothetical protein
MIVRSSFESRLMGLLGGRRFSARAIRDYMRSRGYEVHSEGQVTYHLRAHEVSLRKARSDLDAVIEAARAANKEARIVALRERSSQKASGLRSRTRAAG